MSYPVGFFDPLAFVPQSKYDEMVQKCSVQSIGEKNRASGSIHFHNKEYVVTAMYGSGKGDRNWYAVACFEIIDLSLYKGELQALDEKQHNREISEGKRERSYAGLIIKLDTRKVVLTEKTFFRPIAEPEQLSLF